ncbi:MAG: hypothetical protein Q4D06_05660 [Coriobacteriia bacterium]|nr:hypothetical protein [Coriobacteriia bacterium]
MARTFKGLVDFGAAGASWGMPGGAVEASVVPGASGIEFSVAKAAPLCVDYAQVVDLRLLNYYVHLVTDAGTVVISQLGKGTEDFFENAYDALNACCAKAFFAQGQPLMEAEGDYAYDEGGEERRSHAKFALYEDALFVYPHDMGARRVPLCFSDEPLVQRFSTTLRLRTGEWYSAARLGKDTDPFNRRLAAARKSCVERWAAAHADLEAHLTERLGETYLPRYQALCSTGARVVCGLFDAAAAGDDSEDAADPGFWFAAIGQGVAAVELAIGQAAATYLYEFDLPCDFESSLRRAMEAVGDHREVILLDDDAIREKPLCRMLVDRCAPVRFLREHNVGRLVHSGSWEDSVRAFLAGGR